MRILQRERPGWPHIGFLAFVWSACFAAAAADGTDALLLRVNDLTIVVSNTQPPVTVAVGTRLPLVQENGDHYVAIFDSLLTGPCLRAFPKFDKKGRTGWVTSDQQVYFGSDTESCTGQLRLRADEILPVVGDTGGDYVVLIRRTGGEARLRIPKSEAGIQLVQVPPPAPPKEAKIPAPIALPIDEYTGVMRVGDKVFVLADPDAVPPSSQAAAAGALERGRDRVNRFLKTHFAEKKVVVQEYTPVQRDVLRESLALEPELPPVESPAIDERAQPAEPAASIEPYAMEIHAAWLQDEAPPSADGTAHDPAPEAPGRTPARGALTERLRLFAQVVGSMTTLAALLTMGRFVQTKRAVANLCGIFDTWEQATLSTVSFSVNAPSCNATASGNLENMSLTSLTQLLNSKGETGQLTISDVAGRDLGSMVLRNGEIIDAWCGGKRGDEAVLAVLRCRQGHFRYERGGGDSACRTTEHGTLSLLLQAHRLMNAGVSEPATV